MEDVYRIISEKDEIIAINKRIFKYSEKHTAMCITHALDKTCMFYKIANAIINSDKKCYQLMREYTGLPRMRGCICSIIPWFGGNVPHSHYLPVDVMESLYILSYVTHSKDIKCQKSKLT